jgi:polysaccharide chain length determinant protein (PEP-CTERM system associated)
MADGEAASDLGSYAALLRRRRVWIITIVPAVLLLAVYLAFALPAQYRSTATLLLEQSAIPEDFIKSTVRSYADEQIDIIQGRVLTVEVLKDLVQQYDPYPDQKDLSLEGKALQIIKDTSLERVDPTTFQTREQSSAVSVHYQNPNPQRASVVAGRLADLFLTYHQRVRIDAARVAAKMVQDRATELGNELKEVDEEYARLRNANGGTLPDDKGSAEDARYRAERDLTDLEKQLRSAQGQVSLLSIQLANTSPNLLSAQGLTAGASNQPFAAQGGLTDLSTVKALLADAELRYTPDHPDVKRLKRALAALEAQQGAQQKGSDPAASADNPEYRRIASELAAARTEVSALQADTARARAQVAQYAANVNPSAALGRQVADLDRRRSSLQAEYQGIQEKLKSAQLGQVAESGKNAEHFSLLQAPFAASQPYSPNRLGVILLGLVLGGAIAAAAVALAESSDATVRGARDILSLKGLVVLGSVPEILLDADRHRKRWIWGSVSAVYLAAAVLVVITIGQAQSRAHRVESTAPVAVNGS